MYSVVLISRDDQARERWNRELYARGCDAVVVAPGPAAAAAVVRPVDAVAIEIELAADWLYCQELAHANRMAPLVALNLWRTDDVHYRQLAFRIGCDAYLHAASCTADKLLQTIERLAAGERRIVGDCRDDDANAWWRCCSD
jgi:DNA-binding NarL/FixJ family response regulator